MFLKGGFNFTRQMNFLSFWIPRGNERGVETESNQRQKINKRNNKIRVIGSSCDWEYIF